MRIVSTNFIPDRSRPGLTTTAIGAVDLQGAGGNWATVGRRSRGGRRVHRQREKRKGKGRELADMMERRKVDILCVQETRWKGSKARSIGAGFKLFYYGVDSKRNGVGVVLKEEFVRNVLEVGCELEEKERFWSELDEVMESIPTGERVVIGADFNGHVGEGNTGDEEVMGKFGVKERNLEGQMVVDFAKRMDMGVVNTYFQKREEHRVTYKSGGRRTQIEKKTKWWKLKKEECSEVIRETGRKVLGVSSGRRKEDKETWWWNEEVQDSIQRKRLAKKKWDMDRTEENRQEYKELQRRVKREVSKAKQKAYEELYTRLDTREGEKDLYRLARQRDRDGKDVQQVRVIKDRDGRVLTSEESVQRRWKEYFEELMNEENEREKRVEGVNSVEQKVDKIRKDEVRKALKRMKSGKAVGPDDIPVEVWKCLGEAAVEFLASLFNRVLENLEKAYDRVPREELWYCMRKSGVAEKYVRVVQDMYERSRTVVRCAVGQTEEFNVEVGLHQGSALSPFLFAIVMDQLSEEVRQESPWTMMFADDIVICSESREQVEENLERWRFALERRGMKVSRSKTEYMCVNEREGSGTVRLQGEEVKKVQEFKYLGSTVQSNGECGKEVKKRVQAGWNGWRKVSGVLCDQKISARIKGKVYRTVVRPAMLYGLETVSLRKRQESELEVAELQMLRFSLGVTRLDRIRNEYIRGTAHVGRLGDKVREARLRWFGHVQRRDISIIIIIIIILILALPSSSEPELQFMCLCMMEECEGQQEVLRDLNQRLSGFLEHVTELHKINLNLQEQIMAWKMPLERDWSSQEKMVEELQAQMGHMLMENAELALRSDHIKSTVQHLQSRCELEQKLRLRLEQLIAELKQKKMNLHQANTLLEEQFHTSTQELHTMQDEQERELFAQQQQAAVGEDGRGMELWRFGPAHGDLGSAALTNQAPGFRPTAHARPRTDTPSPSRDQPPQVSPGDEALREARAELTEVRKQWHSLQVEVESLHAMERSLQSSLKHTQHQYSLQLRDLSRSVCELEGELDGVREGLAAQKQHHNQLLNTKMRLEREIATYRRLLEHEEGRRGKLSLRCQSQPRQPITHVFEVMFFSADGQPRKLKPWKPSGQQNGVCNGFETESEISGKPANQGPAFHRQGSLVIFTEPIGSKDGEISTVKTQEIVEGNVVRESAEGHGRVETEKIDKVIKQWEGSFFQGNPKLRKKSVSLRFDLHMAMADEGCAQSKKDSLPDVEVRLVMKRSRSIPTITQLVYIP
ncbi:hypothetical protein QTP70_009101 [Hemibagrus guttatus]|uniref:ribonuclease H n=1 Tax=Hemibagrus guttatus TaxID=175788 RepID=A0AAE0PYM8_9TELE|nr:hypothetical protein QTP70_009101 [Hemibagrus guttatus]